jgi:predicted transposase/invertase (TIGR01784 family)
MIIGIDPKVDYAFKHLFGREVSRPLLIDVLQSVLQPDLGGQISELEVLNPFNFKETLDDKLSILDIKARDQAGRQFNIEMQMLAHKAYDKRILYYATKLHQQQLHEKEHYSKIQPTISISFLNHVLFPGLTDHHLHFELLERSHHIALTHDIAFHILELPKFNKAVHELTSGLDIWLYFFRHADKMDAEVLPPALEQPLLRRALEDLRMLTQADIERERYEARRKALMDHNSFLDEARTEGLAKGREEAQKENQINTIRFCERVLGMPETPVEKLTMLPLNDLTRRAQELQAAVLKQSARG